MPDDVIAIVHQLFAREVPEIAVGDVQIKAVSREVGCGVKVAIQAVDSTVDPIAACVGVRGGRIKHVVDALDGERVDLVRWHNDVRVLVANSLQPAEIQAVVIDPAQRRATVFVASEQLSLVMGRRGINVNLASALCGYEIVVETT